MRKFKKIKVVEYSGYKGAQKPIRFFYNGKEYIIYMILENYYEKNINTNENYNVFEIKTKEGKCFKLFYSLNKKEWFIKETNDNL